MNKTVKIFGAIIGVLLLFGLFFMGSYNGLVSQKANVEQAEAKIEATLQRRYDLIPNVVNSVKGYMAHEDKIFTEIAEARAKIGSNSTTSDDKKKAEGELDSAISRLLVVKENYPELKSNEQVQTLITELEGTENRIYVARTDYNKVATQYNTKIQKFPTNIVANMFGFEKVELVEATKAAKETVPSVNLKNE